MFKNLWGRLFPEWADTGVIREIVEKLPNNFVRVYQEKQQANLRIEGHYQWLRYPWFMTVDGYSGQHVIENQRTEYRMGGFVPVRAPYPYKKLPKDYAR